MSLGHTTGGLPAGADQWNDISAFAGSDYRSADDIIDFVRVNMRIREADGRMVVTGEGSDRRVKELSFYISDELAAMDLAAALTDWAASSIRNKESRVDRAAREAAEPSAVNTPPAKSKQKMITAPTPRSTRGRASSTQTKQRG